MCELTWEQMEELEGGGWKDFMKGAACAAGFLAVAYFTGPAGVQAALYVGAGASCLAML